MLKSLWSRVWSYENRDRLSQFVMAIPDWSTLLVLGRSRLLALTAVVPFLGSLILFNEQIVQFLTLSPEVVAKWLGGTVTDPIEASRAFTLNRLQLAYFGLVFLGVASFLFTILCPATIKKYGGVSAYIEGEKPLITRARTGLLTTDVAKDFLLSHGEEEARGKKWLRTLAYPPDLEALFGSTFSEITLNIEWGDEPSDEGPELDKKDESDVDEGVDTGDHALTDFGVYTGIGININVEKVARILYNGLTVERAFWMNFQSTAVNYTIDLLALRFGAADHSKPLARAAIAFCYVAGFAILFFPTLRTFIAIVARVVGF